MAVLPKKLPLLSGLSRRELRAVEEATTEKLVKRGADLVREGDASEEMYVLLSGRAEVVRRDRRGVEYVVDDLEPGELVGELAAKEGKTRATVRAKEDCKVVAFPSKLLQAQPRLLINVAHAMSSKLREHSDSSLEHAQERAAMGGLLVKTLVLLCGYAVLLSAVPWVRSMWPAASTAYMSLPVIALFGISSFRFLRSTGWPLARFGLGFRNFFGSIVEAAVLTPVFAAALVALKWILVRVNPRWHGAPTLEHTDVLARLADPEIRTLLIVYAASAAVQELIVRCALQSTLEDLLRGRTRVATAVLVSALMFSVNHLHMSFGFAALAFLPGVFWGWMFHRQRHLAGVTVSHFALGAFVFFVLGVPLD